MGQFRPEKNHLLQLDIMEILQERFPHISVRLLMIGGVRNERDAERAQLLRQEDNSKGLRVDICVNMGREDLVRSMQEASIGIHTMLDEHFGISVVELQSAGLITVAHRSGGVALDIIRDGKTGYLAGNTAEEYADKIMDVLIGLSAKDREGIRVASKQAAARFSDRAFCTDFLKYISIACKQYG